MKTLGLIPAKGGSKRLHRKNILNLGGKPLLGWAIHSALESRVIDKVVVSTDDNEIAKVATKYGADVPFMRPKELSIDPAGVVDVGLHAINQLDSNLTEFDKIVILLPTCPFRTAGDIKNAFDLFTKMKGKFLMSVSEYSHTPFSAMGISSNNYLTPYFEQYIGKKSQELPISYRANGAIHILDVKSFVKYKSYYKKPLIGFPMPFLRSIDIDTKDDLLFADFILKQGLKR
jgi:CMP-N-acetylneuraminic acid synthetase